MQTYDFNEASSKDRVLDIHTANISGYFSHNYNTCYDNKVLIKTKQNTYNLGVNPCSKDASIKELSLSVYII